MCDETFLATDGWSQAVERLRAKRRHGSQNAGSSIQERAKEKGRLREILMTGAMKDVRNLAAELSITVTKAHKFRGNWAFGLPPKQVLVDAIVSDNG